MRNEGWYEMRAAEGGSWREWRPGPGPSGRRLGLREGLLARGGRGRRRGQRGPLDPGVQIRLPPRTRASPLISAPTLFLLPGPAFLPLLASPRLSPEARTLPPDPAGRALASRPATRAPLPPRQPREAGEGRESPAQEAAPFPAAPTEDRAPGNQEAGAPGRLADPQPVSPRAPSPHGPFRGSRPPRGPAELSLQRAAHVGKRYPM